MMQQETIQRQDLLLTWQQVIAGSSAFARKPPLLGLPALIRYWITRTQWCPPSSRVALLMPLSTGRSTWMVNLNMPPQYRRCLQRNLLAAYGLQEPKF